jgi:hypothetical protein
MNLLFRVKIFSRRFGPMTHFFGRAQNSPQPTGQFSTICCEEKGKKKLDKEGVDEGKSSYISPLNLQF